MFAFGMTLSLMGCIFSHSSESNIIIIVQILTTIGNKEEQQLDHNYVNYKLIATLEFN